MDLRHHESSLVRMIGFYVTVIRDHDKKVGWLLGPFNSKEDAELKIPEAREKAYASDPRSHWYAFGVTRLEAETLPPGVLAA